MRDEFKSSFHPSSFIPLEFLKSRVDGHINHVRRLTVILIIFLELDANLHLFGFARRGRRQRNIKGEPPKTRLLCFYRKS